MENNVMNVLFTMGGIAVVMILLIIVIIKLTNKKLEKSIPIETHLVTNDELYPTISSNTRVEEKEEEEYLTSHLQKFDKADKVDKEVEIAVKGLNLKGYVKTLLMEHGKKKTIEIIKAEYTYLSHSTVLNTIEVSIKYHGLVYNRKTRKYDILRNNPI
jgi:hypothetical protein